MICATAIERLLAVRPQWISVATAGEVLGLRPHELLHAGPPFRDPRNPTAVLLSSAAVTCVHEGWADGVEAAEALIRDGAVILSPAQAHGCVLPLAFVASPSTPLCVVGDASNGVAARYAPLSTLRGFDTRMGCRDPGLAARLLRRDRTIAPSLQRLLGAHGPLPLWPLAAAGLAAGDDLHSRTTAANSGLAAWLRAFEETTLADDVEASPLFFLTLWMAACLLMLSAAEGVDGSTLVTRAGGNGESFGIALAAQPDQWITADAEPPAGRLLPTAPAGVAVSGAIGDSAVIDMLGFGGQRLALAAEPRAALQGFIPAELEGLAERLLVAPHPLIESRWPVGLDAEQVHAHQQAPLVSLSMLASDGRIGFVGRGVYQPPVALFKRAIGALAGRS